MKMKYWALLFLAVTCHILFATLPVHAEEIPTDDPTEESSQLLEEESSEESSQLSEELPAPSTKDPLDQPQPPEITLQPQSCSVILSKEATFQIAANGETVSYTWQVSKDGGTSWSNINTAKYPSALTAVLSFVPGTSMEGFLYRCKVTDETTEIYSDPASLHLILPPSFQEQPSGMLVAAGQEGTFNVMVLGDDISYIWQVSKDSGVTWSNVSASKYPSALTNTLRFPARISMDGFIYRCIAANMAGETYSDTVTLRVMRQPSILTQPSDTALLEGSAASLQVSASGDELDYTWQVSKDGGSTWKNVNSNKYPSAKAKTLTFLTDASMRGYCYRCRIRNSVGTVYTQPITLTVLVKPVIKQHPSPLNTNLDHTATFSVLAVGEGLKYQWQVSYDQGTTWKNVSRKYPSATTAILSFTTRKDMDRYWYRCIVRNADGQKVISTPAELIVIVYPEAAKVLDQVGWDLRAAYDWCVGIKYFFSMSIDPKMGTCYFADYGFEKYSGNCFVFAATFTELARTLGYEARQVYGHIIGGYDTPHSWVEIDFDGKTYFFDPEFEWQKQLDGYKKQYGEPMTWKYDTNNNNYMTD